MACKYETLSCAVCKKTHEYLVYSYNTSENCLKSYERFKNFDLQICSFCGYIATNIANEYKSNFLKLKASKQYKQIIENQFENDDSYDKYLKSYPYNIYEAYALSMEKIGNFEEAIRGYFRTIVLKEAIINRYNQELLEDMEDMDENSIKNIKIIQQNIVEDILDNLNTALDIMPLDSSNIFIKCIYIELLLRCDKTQAKIEYDKIKNKLNDELKKYFDSLTSRRG